MAKVKYRIREFKPTANQTGGHTAPSDLQSGGNEHKDLQSDNGDGIANADTQHGN